MARSFGFTVRIGPSNPASNRLRAMTDPTEPGRFAGADQRDGGGMKERVEIAGGHGMASLACRPGRGLRVSIALARPVAP